MAMGFPKLSISCANQNSGLALYSCSQVFANGVNLFPVLLTSQL